MKSVKERRYKSTIDVKGNYFQILCGFGPYFLLFEV